jgi:hypothetical protein
LMFMRKTSRLAVRLSLADGTIDGLLPLWGGPMCGRSCLPFLVFMVGHECTSPGAAGWL